MKNLVLVSHGTFAEGLKSVMLMLAGEQAKEIIAVGLEDGMSAEEFAKKFADAISHIKEEDEIILLGDIVGGSPMTNAIAQISERGMESQTIVFGGMNLAMALTAAIMKDGMETELLKENLINEAKDAIKEFPLASGDEDEDEDDDI